MNAVLNPDRPGGYVGPEAGRYVGRCVGPEAARRHRCTASTHTWTFGFTLIEILIVISIIGVLISLLLAFTTQSVTRVAKTRLTIQTLLTIADEYEAGTRGQLINHAGSFPFDWSANRSNTNHRSPWKGGKGKPNDSSERFVAAVMQVPQTRDLILNLLKGDILVDHEDTNNDGTPDGDGFFELRDDWGNMLVYMSSNDQVPANGGDALLPVHTKRFFASAGEDTQGLFGDHAGPDGAVGTSDDTVKNDLYSFEIE